jgi:hypothetical protein
LIEALNADIDGVEAITIIAAKNIALSDFADFEGDLDDVDSRTQISHNCICPVGVRVLLNDLKKKSIQDSYQLTSSGTQPS